MNLRKTLNGKDFEISLPNEQISQAVVRIATRMNHDLQGKDVVFLGILNGAFMFASDIFRKINFDCKITFLKLASYEGLDSSGTVKQLIGLNEDLKNKTVVILEDIIDTGITMDSILKQLKGYEPAEIKIATFLFKPDAFQKKFKIDYIGFEIPNEFVIGYGLDYNGLGRNYDHVYSFVKATKVNNILLFGAPGSGKGTQSKKIIQKYNLVHLSTGDILRQEIESNTRIGQQAKKYMTDGGLVPDELVIDMIEIKIIQNKGAAGFVFDGFPRTVAQAIELDEMMRKKGMAISVMFALQVEDEELIDRLLKRAKIGGRTDDTPEIIENRIKIYKEKTERVSDYYQRQEKLSIINGKGDIDSIFEEISKVIDKL
jgi:adenylate kinase